MRGLIVPLVVRPTDAEGAFDLVAGFHRLAAARSLGLTEVRVVVRDAAGEDADRAIENITCKALDPRAKRRARSRRCSPAGSQRRARRRPWAGRGSASPRARSRESARELVGQGVIAFSAVDQLRAIGRVAPPLLEALIAYLDADGNAWMPTVPGTYRLTCLIHPTTLRVRR